VSPSIISPIEAQGVAEPVAHLQAGAMVTVDLVERLDGGNPYYLVVFGDPGYAGAIIAVDALQGQISSSAQLQRVERPWILDKGKAIELAGYTQPAVARLVWKPSRATLSPFYPLWEITGETKPIYIDRTGKTWDHLAPAGPG
jgi:hypothetical protein